MSAVRRIKVAGNPNVGKTSLFNALTGSRFRVGNYPGVTVETRTGLVTDRFAGAHTLSLVDLPGTYSLSAISEDESVAYRSLMGTADDPHDVVLLVLDASNLHRNLYLAVQLMELDKPIVVALTMMDVAKAAGIDIDPERVAAALGVPVMAAHSRTGEGLSELVRELARPHEHTVRLCAVPAGGPLAEALAQLEGVCTSTRARCLLVAGMAETLELCGASTPEREAVAALGRPLLEAATRELICARYALVAEIVEPLELLGPLEKDSPRPSAPSRASQRAASSPGKDAASPSLHTSTMDASERIDRILTHPVLGFVAFGLVMALVFQSIFSWAEPVMGALEAFVGWMSDLVETALGPGHFTELVTEGVLSGAGNVIVFVPQIALLFLFIGILEDSGYMARAAFLMDRLMARVGLHGRAFVPLLSGYACAVPAILATRTISSRKDRIVAILMIPFMNCSARLPIYALMIGALFEADRAVAGPFTLGGLLLLGLYALSTVSALAMGFLYKRTILQSPTPPLVLELPPYRWPRLSNTLLVVYDRCMDFVKNAGTLILALTIVLWALLSFPRPDPLPDGTPAPRSIESSYGGRVAKALEPVMEPIGQDYRMSIAILGSFAAREVFVSTLGLVFGIEAEDDDTPLREAIHAARNPDGSRRYTPLRGMALMLFFVYACQCMSTVAVVRRETASFRWPAFMFVSMTAIAYGMAWAVYHGGRWLGFA